MRQASDFIVWIFLDICNSNNAIYTLDVASAVDNLDGKHAIYLKAEGIPGRSAVELNGLGFSKKDNPLEHIPSPKVTIAVNGVACQSADDSRG